MPKRPQSAGIYCRLSYAEDGSVEAVERQEADCRKLGDRLAWPISEEHIYRDNNRSAWQRSRKRPGWEAMLKAIKEGEIDSIIVYHGDRLVRQPYDLELLLRLADERGIRLASVSGTRDLSNPDDQYILRIEAAGFCRESASTSRRVRRAQDERKKARLPRPGGTRAFGYKRDNITVEQSEADVIVEVCDRLLAGQTMYGVFRWVNTVSTTSTGKRWRISVLRNMLLRPRIAGLLEGEGELLEGAWEPIVSKETWEDVCALLNGTRDRYLAGRPQPTADYAIRYLLSGIARCGVCGGSMSVQASRMGGKLLRRTYLCSDTGCPYRVGRSVPNLDAYVIGRVLGVLNDPDFIAGLFADQQQPGLADEIRELERRKAWAKEQLENLADQGEEVDPAMLVRSLASFDRKIAALRDRRARTVRDRLLARMAGVTREQWDAEPLDVRRSTVAALFTVEVLPVKRKGSGFDPRDVRVTPVAR